MEKEICFICNLNSVPTFAITPLLQIEDGSLKSCCEKCANEHFPGWEEEDLEDSCKETSSP